ncbi:MAG: aminotransferase class IV [Bacteroidales bacterium]
MVNISEKENFVILDNQCIPAEHINHQALAEYDMFYEVMRVIDGKVAFLDDHLYRMQNSLALSGVKKRIHKSHLRQKIKLCIRINRVKNGNIRVSVFSDGKNLKWLTEVIPHHYPSIRDYTGGVDVAVAHFERERPNIKKWNQTMKNVVARYKKIRDVYEVLFYNEQGYLTEGSKSNLFFVVDNTVVTAPGNMVLKGVTRKYVFECVNKLNLKMEEKMVHVTNLLKYDAVFITGTSPKVLPVKEIKACCHANPKHPVVRKIMAAYDDILYESLS